MGRKAGQPTKYKEEYCEKVIEWGKLGELPIDWAGKLGCTPQTLHNWANSHPKFFEAFKAAKNYSEIYTKNQMDNADSMLEYHKRKFMLSAYHRRSEVQKVEAQVEHDGKIDLDVVVSFGERPE